ncbi:MAG: terminase large subunit [Ruminococcus sp.]|nr:terminase large subunit [Ruminococcus sp.]
MTVREELIEYSTNCINNIISSCTKHKWACMRFLRDLEHSETSECPFYWDETEAKKIVDWFALLKHSKGILAGQFIRLTTAQKFSLCQLYGWRRKKDGLRRFNKSYQQKGRKNAKSQEEAGVILYEMSHGSTRNKEIYECYCAGTKRSQSKIIFNEAQNLLKGSPLATKFKCNKQIIEHRKTGSFLVPLCKEDGRTGDGTNPAILVLDEYHQHATTEFYDLGIGSNTKEPLLMIITTAGMDLNSPCYQQEYQYVSGLLDPDKPDIENNEYFGDIFEAESDIPLDDENLELLAKMANPIRAYYPEGMKKIRDDYILAKQMPEKMTSFLTKALNVWVQAKEDGYMNMAKWNACKVQKLPVDIRGHEVYICFDMSAKIDLTSVSFIIPYMDGETVKYILFSHSFIPNRDKLHERILADKMPYDSWERAGFLTVTDTEIVDQNAVISYVRSFVSSQGLKINCLCFDPANASKIMLELSEMGYDVIEVNQSHKSLNEPTTAFREQVYCGNVVFLDNPMLNYAIGNAVIRINNGFIKVDKDMTRKRIDPVDATLCAFKMAMYHDFIVTTDTDEWLAREGW